MELPPPKWLDAIAKAEWRRLAPELTRLGMLTVLDETKFAAYCRWYSRWVRNERRLEKVFTSTAGEVVTAKSGYQQQHPLVALAKTAAEMMNRFGSQFGQSPSDRASLSLPLDPTAPIHDRPEKAAPTAPRDEFDDFLRHARQTPA